MGEHFVLSAKQEHAGVCSSLPPEPPFPPAPQGVTEQNTTDPWKAQKRGKETASSVLCLTFPRHLTQDKKTTEDDSPALKTPKLTIA